MAGRALILAAVCPLALAFSDSNPIIAWASHSSSILNLLPSTLSTAVHTTSLLESILFDDRICDNDAIVLVEQPGLHASDLRTLPPTSNLVKLLSTSPSARQFPYVPHSAVDLTSIAQTVSMRCKSRLINFTPGQGGVSFDSSEKHVVCMSMPHLEGMAADRKNAMLEHETSLTVELATLASTFPKHLVIFSGSPSPSSPFSKRQMLPNPFDISANSTLAQGGILKRYQLLTPGLITSLLVIFFVLVPVLMVGIKALASIQSPLRVEAPKGYSAMERKNQ